MTDAKRPKRTRKPAGQTTEPTTPPVAADTFTAGPPAPAPADDEAARPSPGAARSSNPFAVRADYQAGVHLLEDRKFRQMVFRFDAKPAEAVRQAVHDAGYRWRAAEGVWTRQLEAGQEWRTRAEANALFDRLTALIRELHVPAAAPEAGRGRA